MRRELTTTEFGAEFDQFVGSRTSTSVFRWEALQVYDVAADDASLAAFRDGSARPERSVRTSPWLARIAASTIAGKRWHRVRRIVEPATDYVQWALLAYVESQAGGEGIHVQVAAHAVAHPDFWLFDGAPDDRRAILMHYSPEGTPLRYELIEHDEDAHATLRGLRDKLLADAVPLNAYLAGRREVTGGA